MKLSAVTTIFIAVSSLFLVPNCISQVASPIRRESFFEPKTWNIFAGGSLERTASQSFSGWNASVTEFPYPAHSWLGATIEGTGAYESVSGLSPSLYRVMGGPSVAMRTARVQPFALALFGEVVERDSVRKLGSSASENTNSFALAGGGGADFAITSAIAIRAQAEWVRNGGSSAVNGFRAATGVVFRY